ncbi:MAG: hypothetical protein ABSC05_18795 [Candidatus Solibacter sp.]
MSPTSTKPKTYWSASLKSAVTVPEDDERPRIDDLLVAANNLLSAIQLMGLTPNDTAAKEVWNNLLARTRDAVAAFK